MPRRILLLDTGDGELAPLGRTFKKACGRGTRLETVSRGEELLERVGAGRCDLVLLDQHLGDGERDGLSLVRAIRERDGEVPVVLSARAGDVETATAAIDAGATDFLVRGEQLPERVSTQLRKIRRIIELVEKKRRLELELSASEGRFALVGRSPEIVELLRLVERVGPVPRPVLISGERGTGKELVARAIHRAAGRDGPFVTVNCAAVTDALLESELFGHEKGAYTGADRQVPGKFELAAGGTLFLDEIGNMSLPFQQKILRVVEYGAFLRVGGTEELSADARILAATNADLEDRMSRGEFLRDLYDRLAFEVIRVPALRERQGDVEVLANHFLEQFMREVPTFRGKALTDDALELLRSYSFPGNVRELKNIIERAVYRDTTNELGPEDLDIEPVTLAHHQPKSPFKQRVEAFERQLIHDALEAARGNQAQAARSLGLAYHQLRYYLKKYR
jgi:DNA-binding NtrC family response regulator